MARTQSTIAKPAAVGAAATRSTELSLPVAAIAVMIASGVSLAFEVLLTRLFSLLFEYHFVFVATSVAICGLGIGGALGAALLARRGRSQSWLHPGRILMALSLTLLLDSLIYLLLPFAGAVYLHGILALPPFMLVGLLLASLFAWQPASSAHFYAADLLGAATGTVLVLGLISWLGAFAAIMLLALLSALPALALTYSTGDRIGLRNAGIAAGLSTLVLLLTTGFGLLKFDPANVQGGPPDKTLVRVLQDPGLGAHVSETVWGPFARLDLVEMRDPSYKLVFTDGGAGSYMINFDGDLSKVSSYRNDVAYLPFARTTPTNTLILGSGAGKDIVLALLAGSQNITAVEINPDMVALTRQQAAYNGNILDRPGVKTVVSDGRSFVEQDTNQYDLVYMNLVYSQAAGHEGSALAESYVFTEEAMRAYWRHLKNGGAIGIVTHNGIEGSRTMLTAIAALQKEGLTQRQALDRVILYQYNEGNPDTRTAVLLVTKDYLSEESLAAYGDQAEARDMAMMYVPVFFEIALSDLVKGLSGIYDFARNGDWNLVPTTDDMPFFYQLRWGLPEALVGLLVLMFVVVGMYLFSTAVMQRRTGSERAWMVPGFFALLGAAFMLVQLPLVQRFYLLLGNPTLALVVTLEGLLLGAGLGSLITIRRKDNLVQLATLGALGAIVLLLGHALLYPFLRDALLQAALPVRVAGILLSVIPLGVLLGIPFPTGLRLAGQWMPKAIPALWGLNALAAVLGSVVAAVLAMSYGFGATLLIAAVLYAGAIVLLNVVGRRVRTA